MTQTLKNIIQACEAANTKIKNLETIAVAIYNNSDLASLFFDGKMYTGVKIDKKLINEDECKEDKIKIWRTWEANL